MIGSIKISTMDYETFKKNHDATWVEIKGQDITNSALANLTGITQLPNAEGCFFRQIGGDAGSLAVVQEESTTLNGLNCNLNNGKVQTTGKATHSHYWQNYDEPAYPHSPNGISKTDKYLANWQIHDSDPPNVSDIYLWYVFTPLLNQSAPNTVKTDTQLSTMTFDRNSLNTAQTITGGDETRPLNVSFYHYIKINN